MTDLLRTYAAIRAAGYDLGRDGEKLQLIRSHPAICQFTDAIREAVIEHKASLLRIASLAYIHTAAQLQDRLERGHGILERLEVEGKAETQNYTVLLRTRHEIDCAYQLRSDRERAKAGEAVAS